MKEKMESLIVEMQLEWMRGTCEYNREREKSGGGNGIRGNTFGRTHWATWHPVCWEPGEKQGVEVVG